MLKKTLLPILLLVLSACADLNQPVLSGAGQPPPELGVRLRVTPVGDLPASVVGDRRQVLLVVRVKAGQPAAQAGIEPGDILLELDGSPVSGMADSVAVMRRLNQGDAVLTTILRDGELRRIPVTLNSPPN